MGFLLSNVLFPLIKCAILLGFVAAGALVFIWMERKIAGRIQDRLGPTRVGGRFGWLQTLADGVKLLFKEDLMPAVADGPLFRLAPYVVFVGSFAAFIVLPFSDGWVAANLNNAIFFMLAVMSLEVFGVIMAGWASGSKWTLFGGMREAAQVVSYEVPMGICVVLPVMAAGTMNMVEIGNMQAGPLGFLHWNCFSDPFTFFASITYFVCALASVKRAPFDLAEAESELVGGFHTEYSGVRWSFFFMAEYASMFAVSGIAVIMFWGGWNGPLPVGYWLTLADTTFLTVIASAMGCLNFILKCYLLVVVMMWVRWTFPRIRIDQVMMMCLKYLLPISCFLLLGAGVWYAFFDNTTVSRVLTIIIAAVSVVVVVGGAVKSTPKSASQGRRESIY